jgi:hypothetical protein
MRALAIVLALLVAGLAAFVVTRSEHGSASAASEMQPASEARVLAEIEALRADVAVLHAALAARSPPTREPAERVLAREETELRMELAGITERLERLLARGSASARSAPVLREEGAGFPSVQAIWAAFDAGRPPLAVFPGDSKPSIDGGLTGGHLLWTLERVIETYGALDRIYPGSGGLMVTYQREPSGKYWLLEFLLVDGRVVRVTAGYG